MLTLLAMYGDNQRAVRGFDVGNGSSRAVMGTYNALRSTLNRNLKEKNKGTKSKKKRG